MTLESHALCLHNILLFHRTDCVHAAFWSQFQEFLESQLPRDNMRIHVEKIASHTSVYENEGPDNDGVYSREEMKLQAQRLIDLKERRVKKVVKKKK